MSEAPRTHWMLRTLHGIPDDHVCVWGESEKLEDITAGDLRGLVEQYEVLEETTKAYEFDMARMREQFEALREAAARVVERDASGEPQEWAVVALARVLASSPASTPDAPKGGTDA